MQEAQPMTLRWHDMCQRSIHRICPHGSAAIVMILLGLSLAAYPRNLVWHIAIQAASWVVVCQIISSGGPGNVPHCLPACWPNQIVNASAYHTRLIAECMCVHTFLHDAAGVWHCQMQDYPAALQGGWEEKKQTPS